MGQKELVRSESLRNVVAFTTFEAKRRHGPAQPVTRPPLAACRPISPSSGRISATKLPRSRVPLRLPPCSPICRACFSQCGSGWRRSRGRCRSNCHASNLRGYCKSHPNYCFIPTHPRTFAGERAPLIRCTASSIVDMGQLAGLRHAAPPAMPPRPSRARSHPEKKTNPCSTRVAGAIPCSLAAHASIVSRPAHFSHLDSRVRTLFRRSLRPLRFTYGAQRPSWTTSSSPKVGALPLHRQRAALRHSPRACPASGAL